MEGRDRGRGGEGKGGTQELKKREKERVNKWEGTIANMDKVMSRKRRERWERGKVRKKTR